MCCGGDTVRPPKPAAGWRGSGEENADGVGWRVPLGCRYADAGAEEAGEAEDAEEDAEEAVDAKDAEGGPTLGSVGE